jgi:hypothetical protein
VHGMINLDFADVKAIMSHAGSALMGIGRASGDNRAIEAARQAIDSPLLEVSVEGAKGVLFNITGGRNMTMHEIDEAAKTITDAVDPEANIIFGAVLDENMDDDIKITVVATGFDEAKKAAAHHETRHESVPVAVVTPEPEPEPEPELSLPVQTPVMQRQPFINEPPRVEHDEPKTPPRRFASIASIEPDEEEEDVHEDKHEAVRAEQHEAIPFSAKEPDVSGVLDDDLDVPAFIRRKVD